MNKNLSQEDIRLFYILRNTRKRQADTLKERALRGVRRSVVVKYADPGHFIYELLQNADDALATNVEIILSHDAVVFKHNGKIQFTITDEQDESIAPGHLNSITAIGLSDKENTTNKIGKFGVGFKSVLQYTDVPYIYDDKFWFKIEDMLFPTLLEEDHPKREKGETLFYFKLNNPAKSYKEIRNKLEHLDNPVLFLHSVKRIVWKDKENQSSTSTYSKEVICDYGEYSEGEEISCQLLNVNNSGKIQKMFMFTRNIEVGDDFHDINVAYILDKDNYIDTQITPTIYCFFRTEEIQEGQKFISHAPFLLTDSRQTILKNEEINDLLKQQLASLAAHALLILRDIGIKEKHYYINDSLFDIVPLRLRYDDSCSEYFYQEFTEVLKNEPLVLTRNNGYKLASDVYTAIPADLIEYLSADQLSDLTEEENVDFVSRELSVKINAASNSYTLGQFCKGIGICTFRSEDLAKTITEQFMDAQPKEWHIRLYHFLSHYAEKLWKIDPTSTRKASEYLPFRQSPIVKTTKGTWVNPYLSDGSLNVFLPIEGQSKADYNFVSKDIIENKLGLSFMQELGIKKPDELDFIKNTIIPKYDPDSGYSYSDNEIADDFETIYLFCENAPQNERRELMSILRKRYTFADETETGMSLISDLYFSEDGMLRQFFELDEYHDEKLMQIVSKKKAEYEERRREEYNRQIAEGEIDDDEKYEDWIYNYEDSEHEFDDMDLKDADNVKFGGDTDSKGHEFLDLEYYSQSIAKHGKRAILDFLYELGLNNKLKAFSIRRYGKWGHGSVLESYIPYHNHTAEEITDYNLEGLDEFCYRNYGCPLDLSKWLWGILCSLDLDKCGELVYRYRYYSWYSDSCDSKMILRLKDFPWLLGNCKPSEVTQDSLLEAGYQYNEKLFDILGIPKAGKSMEELGASEEQISNEALGKKMRALGYSEKDIEEFEQWKKSRKQIKDPTSDSYDVEDGDTHHHKQNDDRLGGESIQGDKSNSTETTSKRDDDSADEDIPSESPFAGREELSKPSMDSMFHTQPQRPHTQSAASSKSTSEKVEELKERMQEDERHEKEIIDLQEQADNLPKYSVEWFKTLLQLEYQGSAKEFVNKDKKALSISFSRVLREPDSDRIYILKNPSRNIPMWIEEVGGLSVVFQFNNREEVKFNFEVGNVRDYTLRLKAKTIDAPDLLEIDWSKCTRATINVNNPIELVGSLKDAFNQLPFNPGFNLKNGLASVKDINFVFGPPGTGKTTWLSKRISSLIEESRSCKILVLAPTNKACDVLARKILDTNKEDYSWLYRFVASGDEYLEDMGIVADRESDVHMMDKVCLISTMARLPFDGFRGDYSQRLMDIEWDYVICDEASMIPLAQMMLTIFRFKQSKIYIAGDPLQIGPILREPRWQEENIYTMINLNRFDNPKTEPVQFKIENLPKQYRSLPAIGELFSQYAYNGKLIHHRSLLKYKKPYLGDIDFNFINFISFKVEKYDSIFGAKKLDGSNVHIYSALMTVEMALYVAKKYASKEKEAVYHIGIICPYAPQAQLVERLIEQQEGLPVNVEINVGTIHSFQGDECDMILTLMNPPTGMKAAADKIFLNRQNIINVAISRAKNILCVIMPHCNTDGYENLYELNRLGHIASQIKNSVNLYTCDEIEEVIFGKKFFLENNTFVTSHQLANVYTKPVKRYEVRIDESSIDIQIGKTSR